MSKTVRLATLAVMVAGALLTAGAARADEAELWDNGSPYVVTLAHAYLADPVTVISIGQSMRDPLDVHAVLYLASHADVRALDLWKKRQQNATYRSLLAETGVSADSLFTPCPGLRVPAALARAYRLQAEHRKNPARPLELYNEEILNLVGLRFCVEAMNLRPADVFARLEAGRSMQTIVRDAVEAAPYDPSTAAPRTVTWSGTEVPLVAYQTGEPHCNLAVYSPYQEGSVGPAPDGGYLVGVLRMKGRYVNGVARPDGVTAADLRKSAWLRNMCARYFPACKREGWVGTAPADL